MFELIDHRAQLFHLRRRQELRFVDQHAGERARARARRRSPRAGRARMEVARLALDADARVDAAAVARIDLRGVQQRAHAAFFVVVAGLQQRGGFSRVHGRVVEVQLGHVPESITIRTKSRCRPPRRTCTRPASRRPAREIPGAHEIGATLGRHGADAGDLDTHARQVGEAANRVQRDQLAVLGQRAGGHDPAGRR